MKFRVVEYCYDAWPIQQLCRVLGVYYAALDTPMAA